MTDFYRIAGMPRVIGAVDGSLIPIRAPHHEEHLYVCHKGFHVINAMAVCNVQLSFTNFVCRWHGFVHDSAVFNTSMLHVHLEGGGGRNGWLLGDCGYGIQPYLLSPLYQVHRKGDTRTSIPKLVTIMDYAFLQFKNIVKLLISSRARENRKFKNSQGLVARE